MNKKTPWLGACVLVLVKTTGFLHMVTEQGCPAELKSQFCLRSSTFAPFSSNVRKGSCSWQTTPLQSHKHKLKTSVVYVPFLALLGLPWRRWWHFSMYLIYAFSFCCSRIPTMYSAVLSWCQQHSKQQLGRKILFLPWTNHCAFLASYCRAELLQHHWFPLRATHPHLIPGLLKLIFLFIF